MVLYYSVSDDQTPLFCENGIATFVSTVWVWRGIC